MQKNSTPVATSALDLPPLLNLDATRTFIAICETGSFRRASERVHRSPSAVSLQIGKLEAQLTVSLFHRNAQGVQLTEHGEVLLRFARRLLDINNETMATFRKPVLSGRFRLAAPHDLGTTTVPAVLRRLAELHPQVSVEVRLDTGATVQRLFTDAKVNLAIFNETDGYPHKAQQVSSEPLVWVMRRGGIAITNRPLPLAIADIGCAWRDSALDALNRVDLQYRIAYLSDTSAGQVAAVQADLAVAALPLSWVRNDLVEVPGNHRLPALGDNHIYIAHDGSEIAKLVASLAST